MAQAPSTPKVDELRARLKADPKNRLFYPLAEELRKIGQLAEAEQVLRTGLTHHPTYLSAWVCMGRVLRDQQKDQEAIDALTRAMQVDPGNVVAARLLGDAYLNLGEKVEAIKKYKLVQALIPADEELKGVIERLDREINMPTGVPVSLASSDGDEERWAAETRGGGVAEAAPEPAPEPSQLSTPEPQAYQPPVELPASPFESQSFTQGQPDDWADSSNPLGLSALAPSMTRDEEPMRAAHDSSPFEEPLDANYGSAAATIEAPPGFSVIEAPMSAEVAAPWGDEPETAQHDLYDDEEPIADEPLPSEPPPPEDLINTTTMADLYERQGLFDQARRIYENILARDPDNLEVRARLERHQAAPAVAQPSGSKEERIARLQSWLDKVTGSEAARV